MIIRIYVTQWEIDHSSKANCFYCPIAVATMKILPESFIQVRTGYLVGSWVLGFRNRKPILLPKEAIDFIHNFDSDKPVEPFNFLVDI